MVLLSKGKGAVYVTDTDALRSHQISATICGCLTSVCGRGGRCTQKVLSVPCPVSSIATTREVRGLDGNSV